MSSINSPSVEPISQEPNTQVLEARPKLNRDHESSSRSCARELHTEFLEALPKLDPDDEELRGSMLTRNPHLPNEVHAMIIGHSVTFSSTAMLNYWPTGDERLPGKVNTLQKMSKFYQEEALKHYLSRNCWYWYDTHTWD